MPSCRPPSITLSGPHIKECEAYLDETIQSINPPGLVAVKIGIQMKTSFPVIASTLSPKALIRDILPDFGVGSVIECKFYSGGFNHTYRVKTVDGSTYYLRACRIRGGTPADIPYELD